MEILVENYVKPPRTGLEAFELLPEGTRCQLINDAIIMSPAPNTPHARRQSRIFVKVYDFVEANQLGEVFFAPVDIYINSTNIFQPDIFFIAKDRLEIIKKRGVFGAPDLVIELLSEDRNYDLVTKKAVYEKAGVKEYWVIDPETKWSEGFELKEGKYTSLGESTGHFTIALLNLANDF